jgi:hypothetical protein
MPANDLYTILERLGHWSRESASPAAAPRRAAVRSQRALVQASLLCKPGS